MNMCGIC